MMQIGNDDIERLKRGDRSLFDELFTRYYRPLCYRAYIQISDRTESEDIVQSLFLSLWDNRESLNLTYSIESYLIGAVNNLCNNYKKRNIVKDRWESSTLIARTIEGIVCNSDHLILEDELIKRYNRALDMLPPRCREVFLLSREQDLKYREIALKLNISEKSVESHMRRALQILRSELREYLPQLLTILNL